MRLFIAEKPELGRAIANAMNGMAQTEQGYIKKGDNLVSWAFGHILELKEPNEYNERYKRWSMADLPLELKFIYKPKSSAQKQLKILIDLIHKAEVKEIVHCGDADEEGQILIDEIINYAKTNKPIKRMLINDLSDKAIKKELNNIRDNKEFRDISECGFARSYADYMVGMNMSRAYTLANCNQGVLSVGRVQTPILALIHNREVENEGFKSLKYYILEAQYKQTQALSFILEVAKDEKITDKKELECLMDKLIDKQFVLAIKKEVKNENPPLAYNLLNLQSEASKLYGFSAKRTLDITQKLREEFKAITYNRSDCEYLPESIFDERYDLLESIKHNFGADYFQYELLDLETKTRVFDNKKLSAHYGIIPTQTKLDLARLSSEQKLIYELITQRFLLQFSRNREYESVELCASYDSCVFKKTLNFTLNYGFRSFLKSGNKDIDKHEDESNLRDLVSSLRNQDKLDVKAFNIQEKTTKPPAKYNVTSLLKDLNQVSKYVKDERIKKLLREKDKDKKGESGGIGTPATRAEMIETLVKREFIVISKDKKQDIRVTQKGKNFVESLSPFFTNLDMTALWFEMQKDIMEGKLSRQDFLREVQKNLNDEIEKIKKGEFKMKNENAIKCPNCDNGELRVIKGQYGNFWGCSEYANGCRTKFQDFNGKPDLGGKLQKAKQQNMTQWDCPTCKQGKLIRRESKNKKGSFWYGCSEFRNGCQYTCFEKDGKPSLETK